MPDDERTGFSPTSDSEATVTTPRDHRRPLRGVIARAALAAGLLLVPAAPAAAAPINDNYLASTQMQRSDGSVARQYGEIVDTTGATTQADLFNPDRDGAPLGGGAAEGTTCGATTFGATVWFDFAPEIAGGAEITTAGYDTVVTVYEFDARTARITRTVTCADAPGGGEQVLLPRVRRGTQYTIQVGGAAAATGRLDFKFSFFGDRDADGVLDEAPDRCPAVAGVSEAGGCLPRLGSAPRVRWLAAPGGVRVATLAVGSLPRGARVEARCRRCGRSQVRVARGSSVSLTRFAGTTLPNGARLELLVTRPRTASGRYRYGAIGNYFRYDVRAGALGSRVDRCLKPGSKVPRRRCV